MKITPEHALYIEFCIGCAYRVLPSFEHKYPRDSRARKALIAAWNFLVNPSKKNRDAAAAAADAAYSAAYAAYAADAADAAYSAADAADAAYSAAYAAYAADAADAAERTWQAGLLLALNAKYQLCVKIRGVS